MSRPFVARRGAASLDTPNAFVTPEPDLASVPFHLRLAAGALRIPTVARAAGPEVFAGVVRSLWLHADSTDSRQSLELALDLLRRSELGHHSATKELPPSRVQLVLRGWAADVGREREVRWVIASKAGRQLARAKARLARPDVGRHFGVPEMSRSGFALKVDTPGPEKSDAVDDVDVFAVFDDGTCSRLTPAVEIADHFVGRDIRPGGSGPPPPGLILEDRAAGFIARADVVLLTTRSAPARRQHFHDELVLTSAGDSEQVILNVAIAAGLDDLASRIVDLCAAAQSLRPIDMAVAHFLLGDDSSAASVLEQWRGMSRDGTATAGVFAVTPTSDVPTDIVIPSGTVEVALPEVVGLRPAGEGARKLDVPTLGVHHLGAADLVRGTTIVRDGQLLLYEPAARPSLGFSAGNWDHIVGAQQRPDHAIVWAEHDREIELDEAVLLSGRSDINHFHFLIEYLPRLGLVDRVVALDGVPVVVTDDINPTSTDALRALAGDRPIISVSRRDLVHVRNLHVPSMHTFIPDTTRLPWIEGCRHSPQLLLEMRERLIDWAAPLDGKGDRIFLVRSSSARGLKNSDELAELAAEWDLCPVDPGRLTLREQIGMVANATFFMGVGGAAMANMIFASPGARVLSFVSRQLHDFAIHSTVTSVAGARMICLLGRTAEAPTSFRYRRDYLHAPFAVDVATVRGALSSLLGPPSSTSRSIR